ncbi:putative manganese-dependent inorganic diphosphatase [Roseburia sp. MSJ-14]|uniref:putative manganese-dependent inorganic diphosphatase n=1 Tax=Roseburia sp. MSJ-14 TaxID=2841514 RepID=UPI001C122442|nr:putative manganese-dependent inorganic diphosphatase [Roseburia sp. MSJ-14]MBU5472451.1 putative manganese-dependent inorganic diphosphatase [Roseburia sp. MSJ-14]
MEQEKKVWVIGHKNPDTDSICSAIAYADLKSKIGDKNYEAKCAGQPNEETKYVLEHFKVDAPKYVGDVGAQVKDIEIRKTPGVSCQISLKTAWEMMKAQNVATLPIVRDNGTLQGLIITGDIATSYMDVYDSKILATARTQYRSIAQTLEGEVIVGNEHGYFVKGKVVVAAGSPDLMKEYIEDDDLVILGDRPEAQTCALEMNASCLVVVSDSGVSEDIQKLAEEKGCVIITTPYDSYTASRLINQSMPIKYFMRRDNLITFETEEYVEDVQKVMSKERHRDFPVIDEEGKYVGMISRRNLLDMRRKQLILVDHNEKSQAVDGIDGAEILEIIDHHKLGDIETIAPVFFRNQPVGCTGTIIYQMYHEYGIDINRKIAGLLCSAIISDTLMFRSPTCTEADKKAAEALAERAGISIEEHAKNMFKAGSNFASKTAEEIFYQDFKEFNAGDKKFGVGQLSAMSDEELQEVKEKLMSYMPKVLEERKLDMIYIMLTNILEESSELIYVGTEARDIAEAAFRGHFEPREDSVWLKGVVSRKKQVIPSFMAVL